MGGALNAGVETRDDAAVIGTTTSSTGSSATRVTSAHRAGAVVSSAHQTVLESVSYSFQSYRACSLLTSPTSSISMYSVRRAHVLPPPPYHPHVVPLGPTLPASTVYADARAAVVPVPSWWGPAESALFPHWPLISSPPAHAAAVGGRSHPHAAAWSPSAFRASHIAARHPERCAAHAGLSTLVRTSWDDCGHWVEEDQPGARLLSTCEGVQSAQRSSDDAALAVSQAVGVPPCVASFAYPAHLRVGSAERRSPEAEPSDDCPGHGALLTNGASTVGMASAPPSPHSTATSDNADASSSPASSSLPSPPDTSCTSSSSSSSAALTVVPRLEADPAFAVYHELPRLGHLHSPPDRLFEGTADERGLDVEAGLQQQQQPVLATPTRAARRVSYSALMLGSADSGGVLELSAALSDSSTPWSSGSSYRLATTPPRGEAQSTVGSLIHAVRGRTIAARMVRSTAPEPGADEEPIIVRQEAFDASVHDDRPAARRGNGSARSASRARKRCGPHSAQRVDDAKENEDPNVGRDRRLCEHCAQRFVDARYGTGRFCGPRCARTFSITQRYIRVGRCKAASRASKRSRLSDAHSDADENEQPGSQSLSAYDVSFEAEPFPAAPASPNMKYEPGMEHAETPESAGECNERSSCC